MTGAALRARGTADYFANIMTSRGNVPRRVAPLRRFYKRVARRAERHASKRVDVAAEMLAVTCHGCGSIHCDDFWCESYTSEQRAARRAEDESYESYMDSLYESLCDDDDYGADMGRYTMSDDFDDSEIWDEIRDRERCDYREGWL